MYKKQLVKTLWHNIIKRINIQMVLLSMSLFILGFLTYTAIYYQISVTKNNLGVHLSEEQRLKIDRQFIEEEYLPLKDYGFINIFWNNIKVGMLIAVVGFLSGGILSIILMFWNGFILANMFYLATEIIPTSSIVYYLKHAPIEVFALALFSAIGLKGFSFYKKIFSKEDDTKQFIFKPIDFILPIFLLLISSIIEVL